LRDRALGEIPAAQWWSKVIICCPMQVNPSLPRFCQFTPSAEQSGPGQLKSGDNSTATSQYKRVSVYRGYGVASCDWGEMNFASGSRLK
jgi:hypothetical protein